MPYEEKHVVPFRLLRSFNFILIRSWKTFRSAFHRKTLYSFFPSLLPSCCCWHLLKVKEDVGQFLSGWRWRVCLSYTQTIEKHGIVTDVESVSNLKIKFKDGCHYSVIELLMCFATHIKLAIFNWEPAVLILTQVSHYFSRCPPRSDHFHAWLITYRPCTEL